MKKLAVMLVACTFSLVALAQNNKATVYGKKFDNRNIVKAENIEVALLTEATGVHKMSVKDVTIEGELAQVCQAEGCWIKLKNPQGQDVLVKFKDHSFLVPKDLKASKIVAHGTLIRKVVSVEEQQHMLEDEGASEKEILKITEPKQELRMEADGIVVYQ